MSDARAALELFVQVARERRASRTLKDFSDWTNRCRARKSLMRRKTHYTESPIKPMRVYEEMNRVLPRDTVYVTTIGLSQIAGAQFLNVFGPRQWINCGQAGPLGWTMPAALGVVAADPTRQVVALSGDYDFQFMVEELAVGAQFRLPYVHVLVNNSYLGLIRQSQRGFDMDFCVHWASKTRMSTMPDCNAMASTTKPSFKDWAARACASPILKSSELRWWRLACWPTRTGCRWSSRSSSRR